MIEVLRNVNPFLIIAVISLFLCVFFLEGLFIQVTLKIFKKDISVKESYYLSTLSRIGNYLLPLRAGAVFRAAYLKKKYDFDYSKFLSTLYGYYIILFLINASLALIALIFKWIVGGEFYFLLTLFFVGLFGGMLFLIFVRFPFEKFFKKDTGVISKVLKFMSKFMNSWDMIVKEKKHFFNLLLLTLGNIVINGVITYIEFVSIGVNVKIMDVILYTCLSGVSLLISLTPGSLGIREAVFLITSQSIGLSQDQIMQLAVLDRGIMFVLLLIVLVLIGIFVREFKLKEVFFPKDEEK
jgi:uncharacterized protein (TIRG00374 family)